MARYTIDEVTIEGGYPVEEIVELSMDVGVNRHGIFTYGGYVSSDKALQYIQQSAEKQSVKIFLRGKLEFCGYPQEITVDSQNDYHYMRVTLVTSSQLTDVVPYNRFFQDTSRTFADIITAAYTDSGTGSLVAIRGKDAIEKPILQYRETDWQFTMRMASRLGTIVIADTILEEPYIALGIPNRTAIDDTTVTAYSVSRDTDKFRHSHTMDSSVRYRNFLCRKMESKNRYKLGDSVLINGEMFVVVQKCFSNKNGDISEHYVLGHESEYAVPFYHNQCIAGLELEGKVLDRAGQELRTLLDIDAKREIDGKTWFSYAPVTNNGMYSMPLQDEKVMLQWQSAADEDILAVRVNRQNGSAMPTPHDRHFLTESGNHMEMLPDTLEYTNVIGNISWLASRGFDISSHQDLSISAQQNVAITAQGQIRIFASSRISACKSGVESSIDMVGSELHMKAAAGVKSTSKANHYKKTVLPRRAESNEIDAATASKLAAAAPQSFYVGK